jgi:putative PIN family toxin of toxin-antitoxin system
MKNLVLDTNVIVSGTFWTGICFRILELISKDKFKIVVSYSILEEYERIINSSEILDRTTLIQQARVNSLNQILQNAIVVEPQQNVKIVIDDKDDNKFIDVAIEGLANYIITQDKHLLKIKEYKGIKIITPEEFYEMVKDTP